MQVYVGDSCHRPGMQQQQHPPGGGGGGGGGGGQWGNGGGFGSAGGTGSMSGGGGNGAGMGGSAPTMIHKTMANVTILGKCGETSTSITLHYHYGKGWMILATISILLFNLALR